MHSDPSIRSAQRLATRNVTAVAIHLQFIFGDPKLAQGRNAQRCESLNQFDHAEFRLWQLIWSGNFWLASAGPIPLTRAGTPEPPKLPIITVMQPAPAVSS